MFSKMKIMFVTVIVIFAVTGISFAMSCCDAGSKNDPAPAAAKGVEKTSKVADAGNKVCPVLGGKVSGNDFYEYNGKRYGLCCPMCNSTFASDPKKYSAIADKEVAGK